MKKLGFIVNPIAGMGGKVGLKGTDGADILEQARKLGAVPEAPNRAQVALKVLAQAKDDFQLITYPGDMGENEARAVGLKPMVLGEQKLGFTGPEDTERAALEMEQMAVDLLLFAGGDGTARNIYNAVRDRLPAVGIPAGVKIHSAVYATHPRNAGELALKYLRGEVTSVREAEVMDIDEEAFRQGRVTARLYGYLKVPYERNMIQNLKAGRAQGDEEALEAIADRIVDEMEPGVLYIIGPGTSTRPIMENLGLTNTLLGVDVVQDGKLVAADVGERELLRLINEKQAQIIVTVIGGQGYIFGRGNQQLSSTVIKAVGKKNIRVIATKNKMISLEGRPLLVDTGDEEVNAALSGYWRIVTGYNEELMYRAQGA
ncbi:MAG TPA: ATP-NAD kinase family protein [Firmicutes bacterium]|nr:ATP-NAD kinase family protein [Bacillota bacterium]